jgi:hypothetical protein
MHYVATDDVCKVKTVYSISVHFQSLGSILFWSLCMILTHLHYSRATYAVALEV